MVKNRHRLETSGQAFLDQTMRNRVHEGTTVI